MPIKQVTFKQKLAIALKYAERFIITFDEYIYDVWLKKITAILDDESVRVFYIIVNDEQYKKAIDSIMKQGFEEKDFLVVNVAREDKEDFKTFIDKISKVVDFDINIVNTRSKCFMSLQSGEIFSDLDFK